MPHIIIIEDGANQLFKSTSAYATVDANLAAGFYTDPAKIEAAQADFLASIDKACEKIQHARLKFQADCNIAEPE